MTNEIKFADSQSVALDELAPGLWESCGSSYESIVWRDPEKAISKSVLSARQEEILTGWPMEKLRKRRNVKLAETDWWASSDIPISDERKAYRQALRDLPSTAKPKYDKDGNFTGVTWPEKPG
ncbi:phage tail assembly chaperone [Methylophaga sp.]|mgnify:CR=1 FL=1|uniref:phage tail assembly chaperone n=1 Tax=Methylophaga sp. TaxID=2024840 RepID=UPI000C382106|nr:phage tail assembly chaperone [Methylophaga sp.]MBP23700.1 hypothetical protein [Methylophaga sp.]